MTVDPLYRVPGAAPRHIPEPPDLPHVALPNESEADFWERVRKTLESWGHDPKEVEAAAAKNLSYWYKRAWPKVLAFHKDEDPGASPDGLSVI